MFTLVKKGYQGDQAFQGGASCNTRIGGLHSHIPESFSGEVNSVEVNNEPQLGHQIVGGSSLIPRSSIFRINRLSYRESESVGGHSGPSGASCRVYQHKVERCESLSVYSPHQAAEKQGGDVSGTTRSEDRPDRSGREWRRAWPNVQNAGPGIAEDDLQRGL